MNNIFFKETIMLEDLRQIISESIKGSIVLNQLKAYVGIHRGEFTLSEWQGKDKPRTVTKFKSYKEAIKSNKFTLTSTMINGKEMWVGNKSKINFQGKTREGNQIIEVYQLNDVDDNLCYYIDESGNLFKAD